MPGIRASGCSLPSARSGSLDLPSCRDHAEPAAAVALTILRPWRSLSPPLTQGAQRGRTGMRRGRRSIAWTVGGAVVVALLLASAGAFTAGAADPIKIGFGMALTGGLSANGKPALLAMQIWKDAVNKKGGLLGRPVELVFYDDQTNPSTVPGIYTKLLDVDKVHLVVSGYGTNLIAPLMPIAMERKLTVMGIFGLANNEKYHYPNYFQISPTGPHPATATAAPFFELASKQTPRPQSVAIGRADAEDPHTARAGAGELSPHPG